MPTDWLYHWMTLPTGLAAIAFAVALPFLLWRTVLGRKFAEIGYLPLGAGYALAALGLLAHNFVSAHLEFSSRVARNVLAEPERWSTVPGWTIYTSVLALIVVLPLIGLVGVPVSALLLKFRRLSRASIGLVILLVWLSMVLIAWGVPGNEWHRTHRLESLGIWLSELAPGVLLVGLPFLLGVTLASREYRNAET